MPYRWRRAFLWMLLSDVVRCTTVALTAPSPTKSVMPRGSANWNFDRKCPKCVGGLDRDGDADLLVGGLDAGGGNLISVPANQASKWLGWLMSSGMVDLYPQTLLGPAPINVPIRSSCEKVQPGMYNSEDGRSLLFGLGERDCDATVHIEWPDGTIHTIAPNDWVSGQYYEVVYPNTVRTLQ